MENAFQIGSWLARPLVNRLVGPDHEEVKLEPKAMQVLSHLADNAGEVVNKSDLLHVVWNGTHVTEEVLSNSIWELRKALGDDAKNPSFIQTVPKQGYRLIAEVSPQNGIPPQSFRTHLLDPLLGWAAAKPRNPRWPVYSSLILSAALLFVLVSYIGDLVMGSDTDASEQHVVAIMGFDNHTHSQELSWLSEGVSSMLATGLAETSGLEVVSSQRVQQIVGEIGGGPPGETIEPGQAQAVAHRAGAGTVLVGSVFEFGSEIRIDAQVQDVTTGTILTAHSVRGNDVFGLVDDLTYRVRQSLDVGASDPLPGIAEVTTSSLEAFRLYQEGVEARRHLRLTDARNLLTEAISVDPAFTLAYWELKKVAQIWNNPAAVDEYGRKMREHIDRLPERKQLMARAEETHSEDPAKAARLLEELLDRYPTEEDAYVSLSHSYLASHQVDKHMSLLERGVAAIPSSGYLRLYYGYGLLRSGRYPEAIRQFEAYAHINPKEPNPYDSLGETYLIAGLPERALQEYGKALEIDPTFCFSNLGRAWAYASLGDYDQALDELSAVGPHLPAMKGPARLPFVKAFLLTRIGRYADADIEIQQGLESMPGEKIGAAKFHLFSALTRIERRDYWDALSEVEVAKALVAKDNRRLVIVTHLLSGVARARMHEIESARGHLSTLNELADLQHPTEKWWRHLLEGEIALASGDPSAAESAFLAGEPEIVAHFSNAHPFKSVFANLSFRDGPARARKARGDVEGAIALYRQLIRPDISQKWTSALEPRHVLELARLLEKKGDTNGSLEQYRYFLELWKQADEGLPELEEARSRVTS